MMTSLLHTHSTLIHVDRLNPVGIGLVPKRLNPELKDFAHTCEMYMYIMSRVQPMKMKD